jgi:hypothetical protein
MFLCLFFSESFSIIQNGLDNCSNSAFSALKFSDWAANRGFYAFFAQSFNSETVYVTCLRIPNSCPIQVLGYIKAFHHAPSALSILCSICNKTFSVKTKKEIGIMFSVFYRLCAVSCWLFSYPLVLWFFGVWFFGVCLLFGLCVFCICVCTWL